MVRNAPNTPFSFSSACAVGRYPTKSPLSLLLIQVRVSGTLVIFSIRKCLVKLLK